MVKITVNVKTQSHSPGITVLSLYPLALRVQTSRAPEKNLANKDVIAQLACYFGCPKTQIQISSGHHRTKKILELPFNSEYLLSFLKAKWDFLL